MSARWRRFFYPYSANNYKAVVLQPAGLSFLIAIFLLTQSFLNFYQSFIPGVLGFASRITPEEIIEFTNQKRSESGLGAVQINEQLNEAARQKAADMFALNYWAHVSPRGVDPWQFISNAGYRYLYAGENLARDFAYSGGVVDAWMNSPSHRDNLLNGKYQEIGVAVVDGVLQGQETTLVVQMFGAPQSKQASISKTAAQKAVEGTTTSTSQPMIEGKVVPAPTSAPTSMPTVRPTREPVQETSTPPAMILQQFTSGKKGLSSLSGFLLTKSLGIIMAGFLFIILAFDGWVVTRKKTARVSGHNFIHGTFMIILIIMLLLSRQGIIL